MRWSVRLGGALLSAALLLVASPGFEVALLAWMGLAPLLLAIRGCRPGGAAGLGLVTGFAYHAGLIHWSLALPGINPANFALTSLVNGASIALFAGLAAFLVHRIPRWSVLAVPLTWVVLEWGRQHIGFLSFPWGVLGYSQYRQPAIAGLAAYTGVYGVSFLLVAGNTLLAEAALALGMGGASRGFARSPRAIVVRFTLLGVAVALLGLRGAHVAAEGTSGPTARVALVQGNDFWQPQHDLERRRQTLESYAGLTRELRGTAPDLVAWPSGAVPAFIPKEKVVVHHLGSLAREIGSWLLVGSSGLDKLRPKQALERQPANSAFLFSPEGEIVERYDKIQLLPFDEYIPLRHLLTWPSWIVDARAQDFGPGVERTVFEMGDTRFAVLICWENLFPDLFQDIAGRGVHFVVSMTNEAFTDSAIAHRQMLAMNVFRAVENRVPIARPASTGISAFVDAWGRIRKSVPTEVTARLVAELPLSSERTFYTRHGDVFAGAAALAFTGLAGLALRRGSGSGV